MNESHLIIAGTHIPIGPFLSQLMLASQEFQDALLTACS